MNAVLISCDDHLSIRTLERLTAVFYMPGRREPLLDINLEPDPTQPAYFERRFNLVQSHYDPDTTSVTLLYMEHCR